jgi:hypothetical protein
MYLETNLEYEYLDIIKIAILFQISSHGVTRHFF